MKKLIASGFSCMLFVLYSCSVLAQSDCENKFNIISKAYTEGEWSKCRTAAEKFIKSIPFEDITFFSSRASKKGQSYCKNIISQVYYFLIKSCFRLYDLKGAKAHYFTAFDDGITINFDSTDNSIVKKFGDPPIKIYSFSPYIGFIPSNFSEYKAGFKYEVSKLLNFEVSFNKRNFNHASNQRTGFLGRKLRTDPATYPRYNFAFSGNAYFIDLAYFHKFPFYRARVDVNSLYLSTGYYASYYLNSFVNRYEVLKHNATGTDSTAGLFKSHIRYESIDESWIQMDLKRLYKNRLNYGIFLGYGSNTRLPKKWELFAEIRFTVGKNYGYYYEPFRSFKTGVSYFTLIVGFKKTYKNEYSFQEGSQ